MNAGVFETIRVRDGWAPLLTRHAARLQAACRALGWSGPETSLDRIVAPSLSAGDRVVRVEVGPGGTATTTRAVPSIGPLDVIVAETPHLPYPFKMNDREQFGAALAEANAAAADDALLLSANRVVAEGTAWSIFWWEEDRLATPPLALGILPGIARARVLELVATVEREIEPAQLTGRSLFATNAVRGIMPIRRLNGANVPADPRTLHLAAQFWPGGSTFGGTHEVDTGRSQPER